MSHYTIEDFQGADIIDVRDVIARVEELRGERDDLQSAIDETSNERAAMGDTGTEKDIASAEDEYDSAKDAFEDWVVDTGNELEQLESLLEEMKGYGGDEQWNGDWYPVTLINENYFETAMDELLEDIGDIPKDLPSYLTITVDYDALKQDYSEVEFDGTTYYYR